MSEAHANRALAHKIARVRGASPEHRERLAEFNAKQTDWKARCRKCGKWVEGTLADILKGHECGTLAG